MSSHSRELDSYLEILQKSIENKSIDGNKLQEIECYIEQEEEKHKKIGHIENMLQDYLNTSEYYFADISTEI